VPVIDIEIVASDSTQGLPADLTQALADMAAKVFNAPQGTVWVKARIIPLAHYAEDNGILEGVHPVFVTVLKSRVPGGSALESEIAQLTKGIAKALARSEFNIHIIYQSDGTGRVAFGGKLVK